MIRFHWSGQGTRLKLFLFSLLYYYLVGDEDDVKQDIAR
jgi:hypothetical protein